MGINNLPRPAVDRQSMPNLLANWLREAIVNGSLKGGEQLKQEDLAKQFNMSLIPVREGLRQLEAEGLVTIYPNRGAVVSELSPDEVAEIFEIRTFLETGALRLAIPNMTDGDLSLAEQVLDQFDQENDAGQWCRLNWQFHEALYQPCGRPRLMGLIKTLHNNIERYMRIYLAEMNYQPKSQLEHRRILHACQQRDVTEALEAIQEHMGSAGQWLVKYLSES